MEYKYNLREIIYEPVNEEYGWGKYGEFRVLIRKKDGYVNATKLCKDGGKELFHWTGNEDSKKMVDEFIQTLGIPRVWILEVVRCGALYELSGTYVHPDLIPHIASWVSPQFAVKVSRIVNNFIVQEFQEQLRVKDTRIDELTKKIDTQTEEIKLLHSKLDLANENIIETVRGVRRANNSIHGLKRTLDTTVQQRVPSEHIHKKDAETYTIYYCGYDEEKTSYIQCRARPFHLHRREKELQDRFPLFRKVLEISPVPNARTLASEFERRIQERGAQFNLKYQEISIPHGSEFTEEQMVHIAREVFEERAVPSEEAKEEYASIDMDIDGAGKIVADGGAPSQEEEVQPSYEELFLTLMKESMASLKNTAREFPRDLKTFGGWSGKNKEELITWILLRRGIVPLK